MHDDRISMVRPSLRSSARIGLLNAWKMVSSLTPCLRALGAMTGSSTASKLPWDAEESKVTCLTPEAPSKGLPEKRWDCPPGRRALQRQFVTLGWEGALSREDASLKRQFNAWVLKRPVSRSSESVGTEGRPVVTHGDRRTAGLIP